MSDNGPPFRSNQFEKFCEKHGIRLVHSPPWNPESNGLGERWVQTVKGLLRKKYFQSRNEGRRID